MLGTYSIFVDKLRSFTLWGGNWTTHFELRGTSGFSNIPQKTRNLTLPFTEPKRWNRVYPTKYGHFKVGWAPQIRDPHLSEVPFLMESPEDNSSNKECKFIGSKPLLDFFFVNLKILQISFNNEVLPVRFSCKYRNLVRPLILIGNAVG